MTVQTIDVGENHYVNSSTPNTVPALSNQIHTSSILWSLFKFTLPAAPAGESLVSASLVVRTTSASTAGTVDTESFYLHDPSTWAEATVTWNTKPATGALLGTLAGAAFDTTLTIPLDVSLIAPLAGTTIGITSNGPASTDSMVLWSSRYATVAQRPDLVLTYAATSFTAAFSGTGTFAASLAFAPTGLTFPTKAAADALVAGPAVVCTIGIATTITSATFIAPTATPTQYRWRGAGAFTAGPTGSTTVWAPTSRYSYAWDSPPVWGVEFMLTGTQVELSYQAASGQYSCYRIKVNGQRVTNLPVMTSDLVPAPTGGQRFMLKLTFGTSATRRITVEGGYLPFGGIYVAPGSSVSIPPAFTTRLIVQGDSIVASSSKTPGLGNGTFVQQLANYVGADDPWNVGIGGTGYLNTTPVTFRTRIADLHYTPKAVIHFGGTNDRGSAAATLTTEVTTYLNAALAAEPQASHFVWGCWVHTFPAEAATITTDNAIKAGAAAAGVPFASLVDGKCYNAAGTLVGTYEPIIRSTTDVANFITPVAPDTDTLHPNGAGHIRLAEWGREVMLLMAGAPSPFVAAFSGTGTLTASVSSLTAPTITPSRAVQSLEPVTVTATTTAASSAWEIEQTAGTTVGLNGGFGSYSFIAPATFTGTTITVRVRYQDSGVFSDWATVSFTVARHAWWRKEAGVNVPYVESKPAVVPTTPTPGLFFAVPEYNGDKLYMAHFYPPMPKRITNQPADGADLASSDYYTRNYINPVPLGTSEQQHIPYGGSLRTRPVALPVVVAPASFETDNARRELQEAVDSGLDGFFCNTTATSGANLLRITQLRDMAVAEFPGFIVTPMLDTSAASSLSTATPQAVAALIASFANLTCTKYLPDGRMLVGSFQGDGQTLAWWTTLMSTLATSFNGLTIAVCGAYNSFQTATEAHKTVLYASGQWGYGADPTVQTLSAGLNGEKAYAAARGVKNLRNIWMQDIRPRSSVWDEARNTEALRVAWDKAIADDVEIIELATWSDLTEGSAFFNTESRGRVGLDISAWYASWWKTGIAPTILKDAAYLTHRQAPLSAVPTGSQTKTMQQWKPPIAGGRLNTSTPRESVEALVFLTDPAEVRIISNGTTTAFAAPAGMSAWLKPAGVGAVSVEVWRNNFKIIELDSPVVISTTWPNDHREYDAFGSIRGTVGQRASWPRAITDPTQPPAAATPWLPFEALAPAAADPLVSKKWYITHPMATWYVSPQNNSDPDTAVDYWGRVKEYYPPIGATAQNISGGEITERYARRPQRKGLTTDQVDILDYRWEVRAARLAGFDAFSYGVESRRPGANWGRAQRMLQACVAENAAHPELPKFYIIPWILGNTGVTGPKLATGVAITAQFVQDAAYYLADDFSPMINDPLYANGFLKMNGTTLFMPYNPNWAPNNQGDASPPTGREAWGHMWFRLFKERMAANGTPVTFWIEQSDSATKWTPTFEDLAAAQGWFGSRDYALSESTSTSFAGARQWIQVTSAQTMENKGVTPMAYMPSVSTQGNYRRGATDNSSTYGYIWEARGFRNAHASWMSALNQVGKAGDTGTEIVQVQTWNDFAEGAQVVPTLGSGWGWTDLFQYYAYKHKTGSFPTIVRDAVYLVHRKQQTTGNHLGGGATYSGVQSKFVSLYHDPATGHTPFNSDSPLVNIIDAVVFLTSAATVNVVSGGITTTFAGVAGFNRFESTLRLGTVSATIVRGGTAVVAVTSPHTVSATRVIEDLTYYVTSSLASVPRPVPVIPD